jgi:hypothetical protein
LKIYKEDVRLVKKVKAWCAQRNEKGEKGKIYRLWNRDTQITVY